jgi:hypothetical protein
VLNKVLTYITPRFIVKASVENVYFDKSKVTESLVDRYFELTLREGNRQPCRSIQDGKGYECLKIKNTFNNLHLYYGRNDLLIPENANNFIKIYPLIL